MSLSQVNAYRQICSWGDYRNYKKYILSTVASIVPNKYYLEIKRGINPF